MKQAAPGHAIDISEAAGVRFLHFGSDWVQGAMRIARPVEDSLSRCGLPAQHVDSGAQDFGIERRTHISARLRHAFKIEGNPLIHGVGPTAFATSGKISFSTEPASSGPTCLWRITPSAPIT